MSWATVAVRLPETIATRLALNHEPSMCGMRYQKPLRCIGYRLLVRICCCENITQDKLKGGN